ncbi:MAG TPA: YhdP family protein [Aromatoleum sp.]|uniref:YhdP family protein n=1 Tax=Aromatoleum sp. TaxID=2307007 RepID=UPI002B4938CC|nr:YhdP family protein [Aromatoleum sp.]HJV28522.1 YhdP family protein [Aromatoleum sp.]
MTRTLPTFLRGRLLRKVMAAVMIVWFVCGASFLVVREVIVPHVGEFRLQIAAAIGDAIGRPVAIEALSADLSGLRPRLHLSGVRLLDREGRQALRLEAVDATVGWSSILRGVPYFHRLEFGGPQLSLRREADGELYVAGTHVERGGSDSAFSDWLFAQHEIVIRNASLDWSDAMRGAPDLHLDEVDFRMRRSGGHYRFGLRARAPAELAQMVDLRGDLSSSTPREVASWAGQIFVAVDEADLGGWRSWVDYPVPLTGRGGVRAWIGVERGTIDSLALNLALDDVHTVLGEGLPELDLQSVRGRFSGRRTSSGFDLSLAGLQLVTGDGVRVEPTDVGLTWRDATKEGTFTSNRLDFGALARLTGHLPVDPAVRERLAAFEPRGRVEDVRVAWRGPADQLQAWKVHARFFDLGLEPQGAIPGMSGMSGEVDGDERAGRFRLAGNRATLELPTVFPEPRLGFSMLRADGGWSRAGERLQIGIDSLNFENPDAAGSASGHYWPAAEGPGEIDLTARLTRADTQAVWRYLPRVVNDDTRNWLRHGIVGGRVPDARLRLKGKLADFPFRDGKSGQFLVTTRVFGARLDYAEGWPSITGIDGEVRFEGPGMRITAERAQIFGAALAGVVADVPDLDARHGEIMTIRGRASGPTAEFLRFVSESPVSRHIDGFTDGMRAEGFGALDLKLVMPLRNIDSTTVRGDYRFTGNRLWVVNGLPPFVDAVGTVKFTEKDLAIPEARARLYGEPVRLSAATGKDGGVSFVAAGGAKLQAVREAHDWPVLEHVSGTAQWQAQVDVRAQGSHVAVQSDLSGVTSSLPEPLNKSAAAAWPVNVALDFPAGGQRESVRVNLDGRAELRFERRRSGDNWEIARAGLGIHTAAPESDRGLILAVKTDDLDVDAWRKALDPAGGGAGPSGGKMPLTVAAVDLDARRVTALGHSLSAVRLNARADAGGWKGRVASHEAEGEFDWRDSGDGTLRARLKRLALGGDKGEPETGGDGERDDAGEEPQRLPALDVVVDQFAVRGVEFGKLELQARNRGGMWHLDSVAVSNPDGRLAGSGQWRPGSRPQTDLDFRLETRNVGQLASRLGYGEVVRGGKAVLAGRMAWRGAPTHIHYQSLNGTLMVQAEDGQFRKLEPGVGRLLGVLSLQALPRRLTLDFRDVFSEGFAFDSISGSIKTTGGVMRTDGLHIRGPAARIKMSGSVNLEDETQDLRVTVQPTLSESVAIGTAAGLINPVAGVVAYVAQKALSDPLEKLFAYTYAVTGNWSDPKVEKISVAAPTASRSNQE